MSDNESVEQTSDDTQSGGSASPESQPSPQTQEAGSSSEGTAATQQQEEKYVPYARFKELIDQKNDFATKSQSYEQKLAENAQTVAQLQSQLQSLMQSQQQSKPKQEDPLLAELKQVNPAFAERFEKLLSYEQQIEQINQWRHTQQAEQIKQQAYSKVNALFEAHKIDPEDRPIYESAIKSQVYETEASGKRLSVNDLDNIFKQVHDSYSKRMENYSRKIRESYVTGKKSDSVPPTQTGGTPVASGKPQSFKNLDEVKADLVRRIRETRQKV